ncbi:MAG: dihydrolipoamide acetyltransferase family protein [Oscillibacter sp.]|nr:dihydrolipoamide acetyltransferase family protein [Oscillibacter sp.]MEA4993570.1 dihydrolipoamide acetyltransferase family protein [Oscillibacter sp.]
MATEVLMPKMGLTMTEGTIEEWKKKEGDAVQAGDILFSVATDKLTNDVECDTDGILLKILFGEGETVECKTVIAWIGAQGEAVPGEPAVSAAPAAAAVPAAPTVASAAPQAAAQTANRAPGGFVLATPYARKLAKDKGYDLSRIPATGPKGTVVARDVESFTAGPKTSPMAAKLAAELGVDLTGLDADGRVMKADVLAAAGKAVAETRNVSVGVQGSNDEAPKKVDPLRRSIAANMTASWLTSPRVTYTRPVDATAMKELRAKLKDGLKERGIKLTYNHILMKVAAKALTEFPDINSSFADNLLTHHTHVNIGLAVAKGTGLIVPNVKSAEAKSLADIAKETEGLIAATRDGKLSMEDMTGGTFTISSLGPYGITNFSPIINQPELAILGVCDMVDTPVVRDGEIVIRPMMNLCLTADHRVVDGVMASKFLQRICELLENPYMLLV